jgi:hypothetical protein
MGGACSMTGGEEECIQYRWENQKERRYHWDDQDVVGWMILWHVSPMREAI